MTQKEYEKKYWYRCPEKHKKSGKMLDCHASVESGKYSDCKKCWEKYLRERKEK